MQAVAEVFSAWKDGQLPREVRRRCQTRNFRHHRHLMLQLQMEASCMLV